MSFLDDIIDFGSSVVDFVTGPSIGGNLARTALAGYVVSELNSSIKKDNETATSSTTGKETVNTNVDYGVRTQVDPDTNNAIPVVYGDAILGGKVIDAVLSDDQQTMWYCLVICEQTGVKFSDGLLSDLTFEAVYWNEQRMVFQSENGYMVNRLASEDGDEDTSVNGLIAVYPFSGGSNWPVGITGYAYQNATVAHEIMPNWTNNHTMDELVFAIIGVQYNKAANVTGIGDIKFHIRNSMKKPGDCIYDYMTNTRYGAGIAPEEINQ